MSDRMRPISFNQLLEWIVEEYRLQGTIFGIPECLFFKKKNLKSIRIFGEDCDLPLGPAPGPHTQLTQNILSSYLVGGRFIELKTVQKLDKLEFEKPCIESWDEGYNTEWSTELSLEQAYDEYIKAWIIMHFLDLCLQNGNQEKQSFIFNMSIGYDLDGIKTPGMNSFINGLIDASENSIFQKYLDDLNFFISQKQSSLIDVFRNRTIREIKDIVRFVSPKIARSVTLSTMHGCPPEEQESICRYLLEEKKLNTYVKLNPTLLGFKSVREILDVHGYQYVQIKESTFKKDMQWQDAINMLKKLSKLATDTGKSFGVKLSNTLATVNSLGNLPGEEMYMSGRALFPVTIELAARLSQIFKGCLPISYSGGASQLNIGQIFKTGIMPITMATDLLKPGGYLRMVEMARILDNLLLKEDIKKKIDLKELSRLAKGSLKEHIYHKDWRGNKKVQVEEKLPITDCYIAPCVTSCPIFQDIPEYIRLVAHEQYDEAIALICQKNPLPAITGYICDHQCMYNCTRLDYEGAVNIREIKRIAAEIGNRKKFEKEKVKADNIKIAIIGAGPAGLSTAYFLVREGFEVTVFEKQDSPGGVVNSILPYFRIPLDAIEKDISFIKNLGVKFKFGILEDLSIQLLKNKGYKYIFIGIGAEKPRKITLAGNNKQIYEALHFLRTFKENPGILHLGKRVAIIGGGNTAIDSARAALRLKGVEKVLIIYRRTQAEMPAAEEEFDQAVKEGIIFKPLSLPESFSESGILTCRIMTLGDFDSSQRRQPLPTNNFEKIEVDSVISAIGEQVNIDTLRKLGLEIDRDNALQINEDTLETKTQNVFIGGDALHGPSTVVQSMADARKAAMTITKREIPGWQEKKVDFDFNREMQEKEIILKKSRIIPRINNKEVQSIARNEGERCLECNIVCNKCVDVCPNRANIAIHVGKNDVFKDHWQILHMDALCNECGNCAIFCPYDGKPYKDKLTFFSSFEDFENSSNQGFLVEGESDKYIIRLRFNGKVWKLKYFNKSRLKLINSNNSEQNNIKEMNKIISIIECVLKKYVYLYAHNSQQIESEQ